MKSSMFSVEILNVYCRSLERSTSSEEAIKKSKHIFEWLEWLHKKGVISQTEYNTSVTNSNKVLSETIKRIESNTSVSRNVNFVKKNIFTLLILVLALITSVIGINLARGNSFVREFSHSNSRTLPYEGRLLDANGQPVTTKKDITFKIYTTASASSSIYKGACVGVDGVVPDYKGNFTVVIGHDCGMEPLSATVFQENSELYLGVQVGSNPELKPRKKITTAGYSQDAARLGGYELGTDKGNIPFLDSNGVLKIDVADPTIHSTTGSFQIQGQSLLFKTTAPEIGSIIFQPHVTSNTIVATGKFGIGTFTPAHLLSIEGVEPYGGVSSITNLANLDDPALTVLELHIGTPVDGIESNFLDFYAETTKNQKGTKVGAIGLNNDAVVYETAGADFAEYFEVKDSGLIPGYVMSLSPSGIQKGKKGEVFIGVISNTAGFVGNSKEVRSDSELIALEGQVDVLVTDSNGEIRMGDSLGLSLIPGYAAKSTEHEIIGYALSSFKKRTCPKEFEKYRTETGNSVICGTVRIVLK